MLPELPNTWKSLLQAEIEKDYFIQLWLQTKTDYLLEEPPIYPPEPNIFAALAHCSLEDVQVVILGQDPYHGPNQAMGLSFSVPDGVHIPPSLLNIFKEISADTGASIPESGNLLRWATQGVLLLNSTLTVAKGCAGSHQDRGWQRFTDTIIATISEQKKHVVFLLWGTHATKKVELIDNAKHLILTAPHPSPLSAYRGFFGCRHFSQTNEYLRAHKGKAIIW